VRAAGRIEIDERRSFAISPKFEGYVERLHVNVTGQPVAKGQPLFEVYSPELVSAQREYTIAAQGVEALKDAGSEARSGMQQLAESSLLRLRNWDISEEQIRSLAKSGASKRTLTFRSPVSGVVTEKKALQGMRFMPGDTLYQVADLSSVWVVADVFEQDIGQVRTGAMAKVRINAYPDKVFEGRVTYVYPDPQSRNADGAGSGRTGQSRPAPEARDVRPGRGAGGRQGTGGDRAESAVIDSGTRQIVLIAHGEGRFEPRDVKLGARVATTTSK
jgi:multidrug resistance efflux pump